MASRSSVQPRAVTIGQLYKSSDALAGPFERADQFLDFLDTEREAVAWPHCLAFGNSHRETIVTFSLGHSVVQNGGYELYREIRAGPPVKD
jgi:hypothetical protein